jgi:hypothetical protein
LFTPRDTVPVGRLPGLTAWPAGRLPSASTRARRAAVRSALIGDGATAETADAWIAAWDAQTAEDGLERGSTYWQAGWDWFAEERQRRVRP